ncbi:MAG: Gfo/Idh/MocA family protein, partial [Egibacteraceae bacterium]
IVQTAFSFPMRDATSYRARSDQGGGAMLDVGVYTVALIRWLLGSEPDQVSAISRPWSSGVDGTTSALLGFGSGAVATLHASFDAVAQQHLTVIGTDTTLQVPKAFTARDDDAVILRGEQPLGTWRANPAERMVAAFAEAVATGRSPLPAEDAVATATVLDRVRAAG